MKSVRVASRLSIRSLFLALVIAGGGLALTLWIVNSAHAAILIQAGYGPTTGEICFATPDDGTTVFSSTNESAVQQAVDVANPGGTVKVAGNCAGVHEVTHFIQTVHIHKLLTLHGGYTTTNWSSSFPLTQSTTLDAQGLAGVIYADTDLALTLIDLTVQNGNVNGTGGGIKSQGSLNLHNVSILSNTATNEGGGVYSFDVVQLSGSLFQNNRCTGATCRGGGLYVYTTLTLTGSRFLSNTAAGTGGGIYVTSGLLEGSNRLVNGLFAGNTASEAAGLYLIDSTSGAGTAEVINTTIAGPTLANGSAIEIGGGTIHITNTIIASYTVGISNAGGIVAEDYNLFFGNSLTTTGSITHGIHSLATDPDFIDPLAGDYHLNSTSGAIDRGVNAGVDMDLDGTLRPQGAGYDIGAYEALGTCEPIIGVDFLYAPSTPLPDQPVFFTAVITAGTLPVTYTWDFDYAVTVVTSTASIVHRFPLTNTTRIYSVSMTADNACSSAIAKPRPIVVRAWSIYLPVIIRNG